MLGIAWEWIEVKGRRQAVGSPLIVEADVVSVAAASLYKVNLKKGSIRLQIINH